MKDLLEACKDAVELIPTTMKGPDSDWSSVMMYEDGDGHVHVAALDITPENVTDMAALMKSTLKVRKATQAALVLPTYFHTNDGYGPVERVMITYVHREGTVCEAAKVLRSPTEKPRLGQWDVYMRDSDIGQGLFVDALRAAIG